MGQIRPRYYEKVNELQSNAIPVSEYASLTGTNRSYIHIKYDRFRKGFLKNGHKYYGADPGYKIVTYHGNCYVIDNEQR